MQAPASPAGPAIAEAVTDPAPEAAAAGEMPQHTRQPHGLRDRTIQFVVDPSA
jgi:hypothetical protein